MLNNLLRQIWKQIYHWHITVSIVFLEKYTVDYITFAVHLQKNCKSAKINVQENLSRSEFYICYVRALHRNEQN